MALTEDLLIRLKLLKLVQERHGAMTYEDTDSIESGDIGLGPHIRHLVTQGHLADDEARGMYRLTESGGRELLRLMRVIGLEKGPAE